MDSQTDTVISADGVLVTSRYYPLPEETKKDKRRNESVMGLDVPGRNKRGTTPQFSVMLTDSPLKVSQMASDWKAKNQKMDKNTVLALDNVEIEAPLSGVVLISDLSFVLKKNESIMVCGPSGCGKSSVIRAICGLWPCSQGQITIPTKQGRGGIYCLSQRPYVFEGTLVDNIMYPQATVDFKRNENLAGDKEVLPDDNFFKYESFDPLFCIVFSSFVLFCLFVCAICCLCVVFMLLFIGHLPLAFCTALTFGMDADKS